MLAIPAKLITLKTLSQVAVSEYADIRPPKDSTSQEQRAGFFKLLRQKPKMHSAKSNILSQPKDLSFNAAVWLNFPHPLNKPVSLWLSYKDSSGENTILVDEQALKGSSSAMLSGTVSIRVKGHLDYLRASCGGVALDEKFHIEALYVRRLKDSSNAMKSNVRTLMAS